MIRRMLILIIALVLCYIVWWIGPLIAIGPYFPLGGVWVRKIIIALILFWALWPFVAIFFSWIFRYARAPLPKRKKKRFSLIAFLHVFMMRCSPCNMRIFQARKHAGSAGVNGVSASISMLNRGFWSWGHPDAVKRR